MYGGQGNDLLRGGGQDDEMDGGADNDLMLGDAGNDELAGGAGDDDLRGGIGDDVLVGNAGADVMSGGLGIDVFVLDDISDTGNTGLTADRIRDFGLGDDVIDLSEVGTGEFTFRGTGGFTATGGMEVRYNIVASGATVVRMDVDGNGTQDGIILLVGGPTLTADDFLL